MTVGGLQRHLVCPAAPVAPSSPNAGWRFDQGRLGGEFARLVENRDRCASCRRHAAVRPCPAAAACHPPGRGDCRNPHRHDRNGQAVQAGIRVLFFSRISQSIALSLRSMLARLRLTTPRQARVSITRPCCTSARTCSISLGAVPISRASLYLAGWRAAGPLRGSLFRAAPRRAGAPRCKPNPPRIAVDIHIQAVLCARHASRRA